MLFFPVINEFKLTNADSFEYIHGNSFHTLDSQEKAWNPILIIQTKNHCALLSSLFRFISRNTRVLHLVFGTVGLNRVSTGLTLVSRGLQRIMIVM